MTIALITPPATEPLTLAEVKAHLRVDHDHEDTLIADTLKAARHYVEFASGQRLITQAWRFYTDAAPDCLSIKLPIAPVQNIAAVTAYDKQGEPLTMEPSDYRLDRRDPVSLKLAADFAPASAQNGLEIDLIVGFGDLGIEVPETLQRAILLLVAHWYEFRGAVPPAQQPVSLPPGFDTLVAAYRGVRL